MKAKTLIALSALFAVLPAPTTALSAAEEDTVTSEQDNWLNASEENPYEVTSLLDNPTGTGSTGWSRNSADAAAGYNKHNTEFDSDVYSGTGIESWYWSPLQNCDLIWQDVKGLMPGHYKVCAMAVGQVYNDASNKGKNVGSIYLSANGEQTLVTSNVWEEVEVECDVVAGSTLHIAITAGDDNANDWVSIAQVRLYFIGLGEPEKVALNEDYDVCAVTAYTYADVYLSKAFPENASAWFCIPFDMDEEQTAQWFSEVDEVTGASYDGEKVTLEVQQVERIAAGTPYLVRALNAGDNLIVVEKVLVDATSPATVTVADGITLTGTYRRTEGISGAYLLADDGQTLVKADDYTKARGFSAWMELDETEVQTLSVNISPDVTPVGELTIDTEEQQTAVDVYTLSGVRVRKGVSPQAALDGLRSGIYIVGNKKLIKK